MEKGKIVLSEQAARNAVDEMEAQVVRGNLNFSTKRNGNFLRFGKSLHRELAVPSFGLLQRTTLVPLPVVRRFIVERVVWIWGGHQRLNADKHSTNLQCRAPLVLKNV
jgi:hypothetical protein